MKRTIHALYSFPALGLVLLCFSPALDAQVSANIVVGVNAHSYFNDAENVAGSDWRGEYLNTMAIAPIIGAEVVFEKINLGLRATYYSTPITSPVEIENRAFAEVKRCGSIEVEYRWSGFKAGLLFSTRDFRARVGPPLTRSNNVQRGLGIKLAVPYRGIDFELRKEMVWIAPNNHSPWTGGSLVSPWLSWNFRISMPISITSNEKYKVDNDPNNSSGLNFHLGTGITGNPNYELTVQTGRSNLVYTLGVEYLFEFLNTSIVLRRAQSFRLSVDDVVGREYIQNNYLGIAYWIPISEEKAIKLDLLHNWAFNRATQILINEEALAGGGMLVEELGDYSNRSVCLAVRYPINRFFDVYSQLDIYYRTDELSKIGYAPNSLTAGLILYFRPNKK